MTSGKEYFLKSKCNRIGNTELSEPLLKSQRLQVTQTSGPPDPPEGLPGKKLQPVGAALVMVLLEGGEGAGGGEERGSVVGTTSAMRASPPGATKGGALWELMSLGVSSGGHTDKSCTLPGRISLNWREDCRGGGPRSGWSSGYGQRRPRHQVSSGTPCPALSSSGLILSSTSAPGRARVLQTVDQ